MRNLILCIVSIGLSLQANGQEVPAACKANDSITLLQTHNTANLCLKEFKRQGSHYLDSIEFPDSIFNAKRKNLIAIYNAAKNIPECDTVTRIHPIYEWGSFSLYSIYLYEDSSLSWMENLKLNTFPSGHKQLDSLILRYNMTIEYSSMNPLPKHLVVLKCPDIHNMLALSEEFGKFGFNANPNYFCCDGSRLVDSVYTNYTELTYIAAWGDCPSGCTAFRYWKFKVYHDCSVEFIEAWGDYLPGSKLQTPDINKSALNIFPNPFTHSIQVEGIDSDVSYQLYDYAGHCVKKGTTLNARIEELEDLKHGLYFLLLQVGENSLVHKLVKH